VYPNDFKAKLKRGDAVLGTSLTGRDVYVAAATIATGPDFVWIDQEHSPHGVESLGMIPIMARQAGVAPMVRVTWNDPALIKKAYDAGAVAVMVPQVDTAEEAERAVQYAKYPPIGKRGVAPHWVSLAGEDFVNVAKTANDETVLILQMESQTAYENLDEILKVANFDILFVGPLDLSASLGVITEIGHPKVQEIMREIPGRLEGTGLVAGTTFGDVDQCKEKLDWGYRFMNVGSLLQFGGAVLRDHFASLRKGVSG